MGQSAQAIVYARHEHGHDFARALLKAHQVPDEDAAIVAACLIRADLRGVDTHGLVRLPGYLERLRRGLITAHPQLVPCRVTPVVAHLDGQDGFGFVVATRAMVEAMDIAATYGVGIVAVKRSTHFGMAANYVLPAIEAGYVAIVFSNASPATPPYGGRTPLLGTSPLAFGAPGGKYGPYLLDMSPMIAARGKVRRALRRGESIPQTYALDADGRPTTDPAQALQGVMLPIGGPKGSGLSMLMDVFCGVLPGAGFAGGVGDQYKTFERPQDVGHFILAMKPDLFMPRIEYLARMDALVERVKSVPLAAGFEEILMPGEPEARKEAIYRRTGIPYSPADLVDLKKEAERAGIAPLKVSPAPLG